MGVSLGLDVGYDWTTCATGTMYGLMGNVLGANENENITNILQATYDSSMKKPATNDASISSRTSNYQRDKKRKIHGEFVRWWYVRKGFHM